ncbi:unnamed protein product [Urochloa humidicola]
MSFSKAIEVISGINEFANFFQWVKSAIESLRSQRSGTQERKLQEVLHLENGIQRLRETLPVTYNLIDRAEWRMHEPCIAELLPALKDAVYDADDLLDEFRWHELKMKVEQVNERRSPSLDFFNSVVQGDFNKVDAIQKRLDDLSSQLEKMGLHEVAQRFDKSIRPTTSSFPIEKKIFGRDKEIEEVLALLGVPMNNSRKGCSKRKRETNGGGRLPSVPVLPIIGLGGVGKTTLVQHICKNAHVTSHFDSVIWICVSDDFDVKRLTKEAIRSLSRNKDKVTTDNLDLLQKDLVEEIRNKRFLLVLDDVWDDALKENGQRWQRFCAPLTNVLEGSMLLMTTRSPEVANRVCTMDSFPLDRLSDDVFWDFFKQCVFGSEVPRLDPELEHIGRSILPRLKGSPLAAKTIGRLLGKTLNTAHWNDILNSELWQLRQNETDILPALRLSYMYLPFYLKRCFSFCAVYPKDYNFDKASLAEIWVAEGFVEPQGSIPLQHISHQYFEDLVSLSFFQKLHGKYVIHDLMHDMAHLVSKEECFIIKNASDFEKVPQNVRHLSILQNIDVNSSNLLSLCKHTKLRTLFCHPFMDETATMNHWCIELQRMRVIIFGPILELPESIGNLKHLRYLNSGGANNGSGTSLPSGFCCLYNLQIFSTIHCKFECLPADINKLINLQSFISWTLVYQRGLTTRVDAATAKLLKNFNYFLEDLIIYKIGEMNKDHAAACELKNKGHLNRLSLQWSQLISQEHNAVEALQALHPPTNLKDLSLEGYPGEYLPSWFHPRKMPNLTSLRFGYCNGFESISFSGMSQHDESAAVMVIDNSNQRPGSIFSSLAYITIEGCKSLSSIEHCLHPAYVPAIRKIKIVDCKSLLSFPTERLGDFHYLEELEVSGCPNINSPSLLSSSLKTVELARSGNLGYGIECCSLSHLHMSSSCLMSMQVGMWSLPALRELTITKNQSLTFIGGSEPRFRPFSSLTGLTISYCKKLQNFDDLLTHECIPVIERIHIGSCSELRSLPSERFGGFPFLKDLNIWDCPQVSWKSGMVLPSSLQRLSLQNCGDISARFPSCLENLSSLQSLQIASCERIALFPGDMWSNNLPSLQELGIQSCPDLVSIGGPDVIACIKKVRIGACPKLMELKQPVRKGDL